MIFRLLFERAYSSQHIFSQFRLLRAVLSVKDEFYHRHIIQYNLFAPVFDIFRANHRGDNLVSSAILEVSDKIVFVQILHLTFSYV